MLALLAGVPARAQAPANGELGLLLGQAIVLGDEGDRMSDSPAFSLFALRRLGGSLSAGVEIGQAFRHQLRGRLKESELGDVDSPKDGLPDSANFNSNLRRRVSWISPVLKFGRAHEDVVENLRTYGVVGTGLYIMNNRQGLAQLDGKTSAGVDMSTLRHNLPRRETYDVGLNAGAGFVLKISDRLEIAADVRYHYVFYFKNTIQFLLPAARFNILL